MKKALIRVTLALAAVVICPWVSAEPAKLPPEAAAAHASAGAAIQARIAKMMMERSAQEKAGAGTNAVDTTVSGPRIANPYRAYPPSCLADPLPTAPSGPTTTIQMDLYTRDDNGNALTPELVTIYLWRMACSSSGNLTPYNVDNGPNAALLMRIQRDSTVDGNTTQFPTFPYLTSTQNGGVSLVRAAMEPNTVVSDGPFDAPVYVSTTYVLENYPYSGSGFTYFDYDNTLTIDPVIGGFGTSAVSTDIGGYSPNQNDYPAAYQNLPIDGYMSSAYYDTAHSGEGLVVQIYDNPGGTSRTVFASWYTYDTVGLPYWLAAQGTMPVGANSIANAPVYYYTGGGFAGNFTGVTSNNWGTMSFSWANCNTLNFTYNGNAPNGPSGNGSRTWTRLSDINGLNCE